ncbi:DUF4349 domain-containing protein [Streptomyces sp. NPDC012769]|uniref:DUF4349 domain-containing protein n=1 Tax=Streptomyces sp. NPDC012769 TaxID=3364848 RepID=UPI00369547BA
MRRTRTATAAALLTAALVLTGCGAGDESGAAADRKGGGYAAGPAGTAAPEGAADGDTGAERSPAGKPGAQQPGGRSPVAPQHVIRTAELSVEVEDATKALAAARRVTADAGGHVENETTDRIDGIHVSSRIVLRVPQERYDSVLAELAGAGKLLSRTANAKDVTDQVVDVESRIATQRASVARVRALMEKATQLSDVVTLEGELSRRQADLESLLAQQASLKDRTTLATVTLQLSEPEAAPVAEDDERPGFLDALAGGWGALVGAAAWVLIVLAALAPWLAVAAVLYVVWRRLVRPRWARRRTAPERGPGGPDRVQVQGPDPASGAVPAVPAQRRTTATGVPLPEPDGEETS